MVKTSYSRTKEEVIMAKNVSVGIPDGLNLTLVVKVVVIIIAHVYWIEYFLYIQALRGS